MGLSPSDEGGASRGSLVVLVWFSVVTCLILINYYVTGLMVIYQLVVNSFNKILPRVKANAVSQPTLEPHSSCYTC